MLYLTRKVGETVVINDTIRVTVIEVRGRSIKLGFTYPPDATVLREEIHERIRAENRAASEGSAEMAAAFGLTTADPAVEKPDDAPVQVSRTRP